MRNSLQILFIAFILAGFLLFFYFDLDQYFTVENIVNVKSMFLNLGVLAPVYMTLFFIFLNITGIPRVFFTIFSGYVFGVFYGFLYSWIATMIGLVVTFIMVRYLFRAGFEKRFGPLKMVQKMNIYIEKYGLWSVVFLRVIYVVPSSVLNYTFGFTKISTSSYFYGSAIGFAPVVLFNVWAGKALADNFKTDFEFDIKFLLIGVLCLGFLFLFKRIYKKMKVY